MMKSKKRKSVSVFLLAMFAGVTACGVDTTTSDRGAALVDDSTKPYDDSAAATTAAASAPADGTAAVDSAQMADATVAVPIEPTYPSPNVDESTAWGTVGPAIPVAPLPRWRCVRGAGGACSDFDFLDPSMRQIVILPTGFTATGEIDFWFHFDLIVSELTSTGSVWSTTKRNQLLIIGYFIPGGALGTPTANFGGREFPHVIRGRGTSIRHDDVRRTIDNIRTNSDAALRIAGINPMAVGVMMNHDSAEITAVAFPSQILGDDYGVARFTRGQVKWNAYAVTHELAHAALNFVDEYREPGLESISLRSYDPLTAFVVMDGTWGGTWRGILDLFGYYDYRLSDTLVAAGTGNVALSPRPSTVVTPGFAGSPEFSREGAMWFGRGMFRMPDRTIMNGFDEWDFAHSSFQDTVIDTAFGGPVTRPNDRLRNAGPNGWPTIGSSVNLLLHDGDKLNRFHATRSYDVQVQWEDMEWRWCTGLLGIPYPCYSWVPRTFQTTVAARPRTVNIAGSPVVRAANSVAGLGCMLISMFGGNADIPLGGDRHVNICERVETLLGDYLPRLTFHMPYQEVEVPLSRLFRTYHWRFRSNNGTYTSGWTGWSSVFRAL